MEDSFYIGELAKRTALAPETIRYYERLGLMGPVERTESGYRLYTREDAEKLRFIQNAKSYGLSLQEIKRLQEIRAEGTLPCRHLKRLLKEHLQKLDNRINQMLTLRGELAKRYRQLDNPKERCSAQVCWIIENDPVPKPE